MADSEEILRVLIIAGLVYSVPMLFEIRLSPQLHNWIYGYYPSQFVQACVRVALDQLSLWAMVC